MFEASVNVITSDEFLVLTQALVDSFACTPIKAANIAVMLPAFYIFLIAIVCVTFLDIIVERLFCFSRWLFRILKAQYQKSRPPLKGVA